MGGIARLAATAAIRGGLWRKLATGIDRRSRWRATVWSPEGLPSGAGARGLRKSPSKNKKAE